MDYDFIFFGRKGCFKTGEGKLKKKYGVIYFKNINNIDIFTFFGDKIIRKVTIFFFK